jgi:hypothetical protein
MFQGVTQALWDFRWLGSISTMVSLGVDMVNTLDEPLCIVAVGLVTTIGFIATISIIVTISITNTVSLVNTILILLPLLVMSVLCTYWSCCYR